MNYIISVVKPESLEAVVGISEQLSLPVSVKLRGREAGFIFNCR